MTPQANEGKDPARPADAERSSVTIATARCRRECSAGVIKLIFGRPRFIQFCGLDSLAFCPSAASLHQGGDSEEVQTKTVTFGNNVDDFTHFPAASRQLALACV